MNKILKRQRIAIVVLTLAVVVICAYMYINDSEQQNEIESIEKINFELQMNTDKLQEINDTYYDRITSQQKEIEDLKATVDRVITVNKEEIENIQSVVMSEARGSSLSDAVAVTQTILNRSQLWNKSGTEIVQAKGQYAKPFRGEINETVKTAFELVYIEGYTAFNEPVTHFYNKDLCSPAWAKKKELIGSIGSHVYMF